MLINKILIHNKVGHANISNLNSCTEHALLVHKCTQTYTTLYSAYKIIIVVLESIYSS